MFEGEKSHTISNGIWTRIYKREYKHREREKDSFHNPENSSETKLLFGGWQNLKDIYTNWKEKKQAKTNGIKWITKRQKRNHEFKCILYEYSVYIKVVIFI